MNKPDKNKALSERFDREAEAGFNQVPGSEAFFNELKNPFTQKKYRVVNRAGNVKFLVFELLLLAALLLVLEYTWTKEESPVAQATITTADHLPAKEKEEKNIFVAEEKNIPAQPEKMVASHPVQSRFHQSSFIPPSQVDTALQIVPDPVKKDPPVPVDSARGSMASVYHYADYRAQYKLHYLSDILVVDYGDSVTRLKLKPILEGTPASYEDRELWKKLKQKEEPFTSVTENPYLRMLEKGIDHFAAAEWGHALEVFRALAKENAQDQNALFYGSLCLYETGKYTESYALLQTLKKIDQPIFEQDADYYIALALVKMGQNSEAMEKLEQIAHSDSFYKNKAGLLLQEFKH